MAETVEIKYEGGTVRVELKPCSHCGALPTAEDAAKAVAHERETCKSCAVCGGKSKLYPQYALYHSVDRERKSAGWVLCGSSTFTDPTWHSDWVSVFSSGPAGTVDGVFHKACLEKVAPNITIHPPLR